MNYGKESKSRIFFRGGGGGGGAVVVVTVVTGGMDKRAAIFCIHYTHYTL